MTKNTFQIIFTLATLFFSSSVFAAGAGQGHDVNYIPWLKIGSHAFNLTVLVSVIIYFSKAKIVAAFKERALAYSEQARKTEEARQKALLENQEIKNRLSTLLSTEDESVSRAKTEAADLQRNMINEAKANSLKLEQEAKAAVSDELRRAKNTIRQKMIDESLKASRENLKSTISAAEDSSLQQSFIKQAGASL